MRAHLRGTAGGVKRMVRPKTASCLLSIMLLLSLALPTARPASAGPGDSAEAAPQVATEAVPGTGRGESVFEAPGHHFGFMANVLAQQSTPNVPIGLAGLQQLSNISVPGWSTA